MQLQPFEHDDWMVFAGASGDDPKICWYGNGYVIVDTDGICVGLNGTVWYFECNQLMAEHIIIHMSEQQLTEGCLRDLGFKELS